MERDIEERGRERRKECGEEGKQGGRERQHAPECLQGLRVALKDTFQYVLPKISSYAASQKPLLEGNSRTRNWHTLKLHKLRIG